MNVAVGRDGRERRRWIDRTSGGRLVVVEEDGEFLGELDGRRFDNVMYLVVTLLVCSLSVLRHGHFDKYRYSVPFGYFQ